MDQIVAWIFAAVPLVTSLVALVGFRTLTEKHGHRAVVYGLGWTAVALGLASFAVAGIRLVLGPEATDWWFWGRVAIVCIALARPAVHVTIAIVVVLPMERGPESWKLTLRTIGGSSDIRWGSWGEAAGGEEHAESVVVAVAVAAGEAAVEFDDPVHGLGAAVVRAAGGEVGHER